MRRAPAAEPLLRFTRLFRRASRTEPFDATAMALATADATGAPSVRMVLLKGADARGFLFFTSHQSRKGRELAVNPRAALCFHWPRLGVQVRVEGAVRRVGPRAADAYFRTRPRGSQLAARAARQDERLESRARLLEMYRETVKRYHGGPVPRPAHWGGYRLRPDVIEFWRAEEHRLHDRERYTRAARGWRVDILAP